MKSLTQEYIEQLQNVVKDLIDEKFELEEENKKLKEENEFFMKQWKGLQSTLNRLEEENKKLKEEIKEHQLYEEKLEHRIIEFEELLHGE